MLFFFILSSPQGMLPGAAAVADGLMVCNVPCAHWCGPSSIFYLLWDWRQSVHLLGTSCCLICYTELATARCCLEDKKGEWKWSTCYLSEYLYYIGTHQPIILPEYCHWEGTLLPHYIYVIKHCKTHPNKLGCICAHKERYSRSSVGNPIQVGSRNTFILNFVSTIPLHLIYIPPPSSAPGSYSYSQAHNPQTWGKISLLGSNSQKEERFPVVRTMPLDPGTF